MSDKGLDESYLVEVKRQGVVVKRRYSDREKALDAAMRMPEEDNLSVAEVDMDRTLLVERPNDPPDEGSASESETPAAAPAPKKKRGRALLLTGILAIMLTVPLVFLLLAGGWIARDDNYKSPVGALKVTITAPRVKDQAPPPESVVVEEVIAEIPAEEIDPVPGGIISIIGQASPVVSEGPFPFTVHVGSFKKSERAAYQVERIRKGGESAFSSYVEIAGMGGWYRVFVGSFADKTEAVACQDRIKALKVGESSVVRKNVAIAVEEPLEKKAALSLERKLHDKGFFAYTLPALRADEKVQVMVGAFQKEGRADEMIAMLEDEGFEEHTVINR